jgi:trigger factor
VKSTVETLEGNKVKVAVELEEVEFEKDLDAAFARLAKEVRLPGFRPGKAPRKVLEARIGQGYAREEAFREALPTYYSEAVKEHEVDVIAPPEIDITGGQEEGIVTFDAVVEVRPSVEVSGYDALEIEIPKLEVTDEDLDEAVDRMRRQFSTLETVERAAEEGDQVVINIAATHGGEEIPGMTTDDYNYEVGSGATGIDGFDEQLVGAAAGDSKEFEAPHPDEEEEEPISFSIEVTEVQETVLPEPTDEWVSENSEFDTLADLRADYNDKMSRSRIMQGITARRNGLAEKVAELVDEEAVPSAMVDLELENRLQDMQMRLQAQGISFEQFMQFSGQDPESMIADFRQQAEVAAKLDLALRSIAVQESITATDEDIDQELEEASDRFERPIDEVKAELIEAGQLPAVRADLLKTKTLDWLIERAKLVDEDGQTISPDALEMPEEPDETEGVTEADVAAAAAQAIADDADEDSADDTAEEDQS